MGDRAYAQILCRAKDVAAFEELGFGAQEYWKELPEGVSFLVDQEANFAMRDEAAEHRSQARRWAASCLSGEPHAEAANETVRGLALPP
jgi:hypothetical protein